MSDWIRISPSMRKAWRSCPRKVFFRYIAGVERRIGKKAFAVGTAYHAGLEWFRLHGQAEEAMLRAMGTYRMECDKMGFVAEEFVAHQIVAYVAGYLNRFGVSPGERLETEVEAFAEGDGEIGFIDCIVTLADGRRFVVEDKTTSQFTDAQAMAWSLRFDDQVTTYVAALRARGERCDGALYRQVLKTRTYPKKGESTHDYAERVLGEYLEREDLYREIALTWTDEELETLSKRREAQSLELVSFLDEPRVEAFPCNPDSCIGPYGACDYLRLCATGRDGSEREFKPNGKEARDGGRYQRQIWSGGSEEGGGSADDTIFND